MNNEDIPLLKRLNKLFVQRRNFTFKLPSSKSSVILLLSGGLDSVSLLYLLLSKYKYNVYPLYFYTDQPKDGQVAAIKFFEKFFSKKFKSLFHPVEKFKLYELFKFDENDINTTIWGNPQLIGQNYFSDGCEHNVYLHNRPTRIGYYAMGAYEYSLFLKHKKNVNIPLALCGINTDDTRMRTSNLSVLRSINLSISSLLGDYLFQFSAPIELENNFFYTKTDLVRIGIKAGLDLNKTWSCIRHTPKHCGNCSGCIERKKVFKGLKIIDKTIYIDNKKSPIKLMKDLIQQSMSPRKNKKLYKSTNEPISFSSRYRINKHSFNENSKKGIFVYIPKTNLYCHFVGKKHKELFYSLNSQEVIIPSSLLNKKITEDDIRSFMIIVSQSGLAFKIK